MDDDTTAGTRAAERLRLQELHPHATRAQVVRMAARTLGSVSVIVTTYFLLPLGSGRRAGALAAIRLGMFGA